MSSSGTRDANVRHFVAIDTGDDDSIVAHVVREHLFDRARQGSRVRAVVTPRLGYVRSVEVVAPPRASAASAPVVHHELVEDRVNKAGSMLSGSLQGVLARLAGVTDADGRPVLDQTDDDGVSLRDRLAEGDTQLDRLRNDPSLRNSPLGGFYAFLGDAVAESERPGTSDPDSSGHSS